MEKKKSEYYLIARANGNSYPLLIEDDGCPYYIIEEQKIKNPERMFFCIGPPKPRNPKMVDYHPVPYSVVSQKIHDVLMSINIEGIQLIPATIIGKNNELYEDYFYLHIYNILPVLDKELSVYEWDDFLEKAGFIDKLVLDENKLYNIPLHNRLVFKLKEKDTLEIYHQSIVDKIMESNPEGLQFINVSDWG